MSVPPATKLNEQQALGALGGKVFAAAREAAIQNTPHFLIAVGSETLHHPGRQLVRGFGMAAAGGCLLIPGSAEGAAGALVGVTSAGGGAGDLLESLSHWRDK